MKRYAVAYVDCCTELFLGIVEAGSWHEAVIRHLTKVFENDYADCMIWLAKMPIESLSHAQYYCLLDNARLDVKEIT